MIEFELKHPNAEYDMLGFLPEFWSASNLAKAKEQADHNYKHGGGWNSFAGFKMTPTGIKYPGDREIKLLAEGKLREETIRIYESAWVAIVQLDGSYEIARMD